MCHLHSFGSTFFHTVPSSVSPIELSSTTSMLCLPTIPPRDLGESTLLSHFTRFEFNEMHCMDQVSDR